MSAKRKRGRRNPNDWACVDLTISGAHLDPDTITKALGMRPDRSIRRGELYGKRRSEVGYWALAGRPPSGRLEIQMENILKRITPVKNRLRSVMSRESTIKHVILTIGLLPAEDVQVYTCLFKSDLVNAFTSLGVDIALAIYLFQRDETKRS